MVLRSGAAVILHGAHRCERSPRPRGGSPDLRHLMSMNFSAPRSAPEARFGDHVIDQLHRRLRGDHRIAAMGDVWRRDRRG